MYHSGIYYSTFCKKCNCFFHGYQKICGDRDSVRQTGEKGGKQGDLWQAFAAANLQKTAGIIPSAP